MPRLQFRTPFTTSRVYNLQFTLELVTLQGQTNSVTNDVGRSGFHSRHRKWPFEFTVFGTWRTYVDRYRRFGETSRPPLLRWKRKWISSVLLLSFFSLSPSSPSPPTLPSLLLWRFGPISGHGFPACFLSVSSRYYHSALFCSPLNRCSSPSITEWPRS